MTEQKLKNKLLNLKKSEWKVENYDFNLALEALENIGSTDPVLRDELILEFLFNSIVEKKLEKQEIKTLLKKCLSDNFLFHKIEERVGDGVFKRSFTSLIVRWIVYYHNEIDGTLLTKEEISEVFEKSIKYFKLEKDKRGYVPEKGWAHSFGHIGDLLRTLAISKEIGSEKLLKMLYLIKEKIAIHDYVFINEEAERLTTAILYSIERKILKEEEIKAWIDSFKEIKIQKHTQKHIISKKTSKIFSGVFISG